MCYRREKYAIEGKNILRRRKVCYRREKIDNEEEELKRRYRKKDVLE